MPALAAQRNRQRTFHLPAPMGGVNSVTGGSEMPASDMIYCWNLISAELGLRSRLGWYEWVTGLDGEVRSMLPFTGSTKDGSQNRLFATTQTGIWNVSASTNNPTQVVTFVTSSVDSGWGISCAFTDLSGGHWLLYCDEANGYYTYSEATTTWLKVTQGGGGTQISVGDPTKFVAVLPWKNRLWFVEKDTQRAWYLPLQSIYGAATSFTFGSRFQAGGDLRTLASWTVDGGSGPDDRLVVVSGGGDVIVYQGTDPANAATFSIVGVWGVFGVPSGRRLTTDWGGDLLLMSTTGILPLSKLVIGNPVLDRTQYSTAKIGNLFNQLQANTAGQRGWTMCYHPKDACLMVLAPTSAGQPSQPLVMSFMTRGWFRYRDMPIGLCAAPWDGTVFFGTPDGRVCVNDGYVDGVTLASPSAYSPIKWSLLSAYSNLGAPIMKRLLFTRSTVMSIGGAVQLNVEARYRWDQTEAASPSAAVTAGAGLWGTALWGTGRWGGSYAAQQYIFGANGVGPDAAVAVAGSSTSRMTLTQVDVIYDTGGTL